jgi:hypothetical protein
MVSSMSSTRQKRLYRGDDRQIPVINLQRSEVKVEDLKHWPLYENNWGLDIDFQ